MEKILNKGILAINLFCSYGQNIIQSAITLVIIPTIPINPHAIRVLVVLL